jgi:hypothetical protein
MFCARQSSGHSAKSSFPVVKSTNHCFSGRYGLDVAATLSFLQKHGLTGEVRFGIFWMCYIVNNQLFSRVKFVWFKHLL